MEEAGVGLGVSPTPGRILWRDFERSLRDTGLFGFPRYVCNPGAESGGGQTKRVFVPDPRRLQEWWGKNRDSGMPLFAAHNALEPVHPDYDVSKALIHFETGFGDFDTGDGTGMTGAEVREEVQKAAQSAIDKQFDHAWVASGSMGANGNDEGSPAGFHLIPFFERELQDERYLHRYESAFWRGWKAEMSNRSINQRCMNPTQMRRIPYSRYSHKKDPTSNGYKVEANYCVPVPYSWVVDGNWEAIRDLSFHPRVLDPETEPVRYVSGFPRSRIERIVNLQGWGAFAHELGELHPFPSETPPEIAGSFYAINRTIIPARLCLQVLPFGANPRHAVRLAWVHEVIATGLGSGKPYSLAELLDMTDRLSEEARWEDRGNVKERHYQVGNAHRKPYAIDRETGKVRQHPFSCQWLRENGVCVGAKCPLFRSQFPGEWEEMVAADPSLALETEIAPMGDR